MNKAKCRSLIEASAHAESIEEMFGLPRCEIEEFKIENRPLGKTSQMVYSIILKEHPTACSHCGSTAYKFHSYRLVHVNHAVQARRNTVIEVHIRRYTCEKCGRTFSEYNPFHVRRRRLSYEVLINILEDLKIPESTFTNVGRKYNVSSTTVTSIFDQHVSMSRLPLSEYMSIDENYAIKTDRSKYVLVLLDFMTQDAIDILPNRFQSDLKRYFQAIPIEERKKVKAIGIDMYPVYRDVIRDCFPLSTKVVVDHFHLVKEFNEQADTIRKALMKDVSHKLNQVKYHLKKLKERPDALSQAVQEEIRAATYERTLLNQKYTLLKKFHWILFRPSNDPLFDVNRKKQYNHTFKEYLNLADLKNKLYSLDPSLVEIEELKEGLTNLYTFESYEEGAEFFDNLVELFRCASTKEMRHFGATMARWRNEILNSLNIIDKEGEVLKDGSVKIRNRRLHNGHIERKNKVIKIIKNVSCGYRNFKRFRNRVLYVLRKNSTYSLDPLYGSKANRKAEDKDEEDA